MLQPVVELEGMAIILIMSCMTFNQNLALTFRMNNDIQVVIGSCLVAFASVLAGMNHQRRQVNSMIKGLSPGIKDGDRHGLSTRIIPLIRPHLPNEC